MQSSTIEPANIQSPSDIQHLPGGVYLDSLHDITTSGVSYLTNASTLAKK